MSGKVSHNSHSVGTSTRQVTVTAISADGTTALTVDKTGVEVRVPLYWQRTKGQLPAVGEQWVLTQDLGQWSFGMIVASSAAPFSTWSGTSVSATGNVAGGTVSATGAVSGASVAATGAVSGASVAATGQVSGGKGSFSGSQAGAAILSVTNTHSAPTAPAVQITSQAAGDQALGIEVTGDANERFAVDSNGQHAWGPGTAAADLFLNRLSAGVLRLSGDLKLTGNFYLDANWQTSGSFANGWGGTFGYRRIALNLMVVAYTLTTGTVADGTQVTTVPSAYYPLTNRHIPATTDALKTNGSSFEAARLRLDGSGIITCWGIGTAATFVDGCMLVPLDF